VHKWTKRYDRVKRPGRLHLGTEFK
jgi:hypothetical protein